MHKQKTTRDLSRDRRETVSRVVTIYYLKCPVAIKIFWDTHTKRTCDTQEEKVGSRHNVWGDPDVGLSWWRLQGSYYKYVQKKTYLKN